MPTTRTPLWIIALITATILLSNCEKVANSGGYRATDGPYSYNNTPAGSFEEIVENPFIKTADSATSTFSKDADGASYAMVRKLIGTPYLESYLPAIRTEELINYFTYNYPGPTDNRSIAVNGEVAACPWSNTHKLIRIGIKGQEIPKASYPLANFVLLIDVSGSMSSSDKLGLLVDGFKDFVNQMRPEDRIAIVTYAGNTEVVLTSTPGTEKEKIISALNKLSAGGSTNGGSGIKLAYEIAEKNFITGGNNRVILGTDGDFNVGITSTDELIKLVESKRDKNIFFTSLGVGIGYINEAMLEKIANKGNGNFEYLDSKDELKKVFVDEYSKFVTVAQDVKIQVTFNTNLVEEYRLIGYENRVLQNNDFTNDKKDAGEIGAGQTITAIYEIKPKQVVDFKLAPSFTIHFRYKKPTEATSIPLDLDIFDEGKTFENASENMRFAASLAALGMHLRKSAYKGSITLESIKQWAGNAQSFDPNGYRTQHLKLLNTLK